MRRYTAVEKYSFVFQIKMLFVGKCMSPTKNAISCPWEHAVQGISDNLGIKVVACCSQLPHEALSNYLVVDHVAHSKFDASSSPWKKKIAHRQVRRTRGPRPITPFTHQSARKLPPKISHSCVKLVAVVKISLIGRFLLIFDNFENVYLFSNPNISAKTVLKYTWHIPKFKLDITELNASCLSVIALLIFKLYWIKEEYFLGGHPVYKGPKFIAGILLAKE